MINRLPWLHGKGRSGPATRLSARVRLGEAIEEAQSSLEQFSGLSAPSQVQLRTRAMMVSLAQHFQHLKGASIPRSVLWTRRRGGDSSASGNTDEASETRPSSRRANWQRIPAHLGIVLLLSLLILAGGFRSVLARPVRSNQSIGWYRLGTPEQTSGTLSAYESIPPMPVMLSNPRQAAPVSPPDITEEENASSDTPLSGEVTQYSVQDGDTLGAIAARFNLSVETLYWFNDLESAELLSIGQELQIPPVDGLLHTVEEGETLDSIAEEYGVLKGNMIAYAANNLREPYTLKEDQELYVPFAAKPIPRPAAVSTTYRPSYIRTDVPSYGNLPGGERFSWPAGGRITDRFGWTGTRWHTGVDIAAPWGTPIYASAAGAVTYAGWRGNYGYYVEIDHGEGWVTRYGHMAQYPEVNAGDWVGRMQLIGFIGCTGYCTGPHVHLEIRYNGNYVDPLDYIQ
jgi:murein DD-endopeptidase MepM/ murein hydrolase activator NlpD